MVTNYVGHQSNAPHTVDAGITEVNLCVGGGDLWFPIALVCCCADHMLVTAWVSIQRSVD